MILALLAYVEHIFDHRVWSSVSEMRVIQIGINELNTLSPTYLMLNMALKLGIKQKSLSVADKLDIINCSVLSDVCSTPGISTYLTV
jgi:hypothetical protein